MHPRRASAHTSRGPKEWNRDRVVNKRDQGEGYDCDRPPDSKKGAQAWFADFENEAIACSARWHISQPGRPGGSLICHRALQAIASFSKIGKTCLCPFLGIWR